MGPRGGTSGLLYLLVRPWLALRVFLLKLSPFIGLLFLTKKPALKEEREKRSLGLKMTVEGEATALEEAREGMEEKKHA